MKKIFVILALAIFITPVFAVNIYHEPIKKILSNEPVNFNFDIGNVNAGAEYSVKVRYKTNGGAQFDELNLLSYGTNSYAGTLFPNMQTGKKFQYFIEVLENGAVVATLPEINAEQTPFLADVEEGVGVPKVRILSPEDRSVIREGMPVILVGIEDEQALLDFKTFKIKLNGNDITQKALISETMVSYLPASPLSEGNYKFEVSVADTKGNSFSKESNFIFRKQDPQLLTYKGQAGMDSLLYSTDKSASSNTREPIEWNVWAKMDMEMGVLNSELYIKQDSKESPSAQPYNRFKALFYDDSKNLVISYGDTNPQLSDMVLSGILVQGYDIDLDILGLLGLRKWLKVHSVAGKSKRAVSDLSAGTFSQDVTGFQVYANLLGLETALNYARFKDDTTSLVSPNYGSTTPKDNQALSIKNEINLFALNIQNELAASLYYSDTFSPIITTTADFMGQVITLDPAYLASTTSVDKSVYESLFEIVPPRKSLLTDLANKEGFGVANNFSFKLPLLREFYINGDAKYAMPGYKSFGASAVQPDNVEYSADAGLRLFGNLLSIKAGTKWQRNESFTWLSGLASETATDNLATYTDTNKLSGTFAIPWLPVLNYGYQTTAKTNKYEDNPSNNVHVKNKMTSLIYGISDMQVAWDNFSGKLNINYNTNQYIDETDANQSYDNDVMGFNLQTDLPPFQLKLDYSNSIKNMKGSTPNSTVYNSYGGKLYYDFIAKVFSTYAGAKIITGYNDGAVVLNQVDNSKLTLSFGGVYRFENEYLMFNDIKANFNVDLVTASDKKYPDDKAKNFSEFIATLKISTNF